MPHIGDEVAGRRESARQSNGMFGSQPNTDPDITLPITGFSPEQMRMLRDEPIAWNALVDSSVDFLSKGMPSTAEIASFDYADEGDWLTVVECYDEFGVDLEPAEYSHINDVLRTMRSPDNDYDGNLVATADGTFGWIRRVDYNAETAETAKLKYTSALQHWVELRAAIQNSAVADLQAILPDYVSETKYGWSAEGPHLTLMAAYDIAGFEVPTSNSLGLLAEYRRVELLAGLIQEPEEHGFVLDTVSRRFHLPRTPPE